jgi:predicted O-methyltransferase YrrM
MKQIFSTLVLSLRYLWFLLRSHSRFAVHSPFVYDLITNVFKDQTPYPEYKIAENARRQCLRSRRIIEISYFGATSRKKSFLNPLKQVREIAQSAIGRRSGRLLHRLVKHFAPETILELGTSIGISALYLASAAPEAKMVTLEGCASTAELAADNIRGSGLKNVEIHTGEFSIVLPGYLKTCNKIDFAFFDGNHTFKATMAYFNSCLPYAGENTVFVFHDIHWSGGMADAWKLICANKGITVTIDLFDIGLVFFNKGLSKQDFVIRF